MFEPYAREFVGIGNYLQKEPEYVRGNYIVIPKEKLIGMLNRNRFDTADNKLKVWKTMKWIDTDKDRRVTRRVYDQKTGEYIPSVKLDRKMLKLLKTLCDSEN